MGALVFLSACDGSRGLQLTAEKDEPQYRRGIQALNSNQKSIALEAFQKVIDKRQGEAPQSHFEVGKIYLEHLKDYVPAIYHFRRYLEITGPNGDDAPRVNQMIETGKKEFARTLAGNPLEAPYDRLDLLEQIARLKDEKTILQAELDRVARGGRSATAGSPAAVANNTARQPPPVAPVVQQSSPWTNAIGDTTPAPEVAPINPANPAGNTAFNPPPAADSGRRYTVERGDTLVAISRKFYGSPSQWRAIYDANRDRIPDPNSLRIGTELRLP